MSRSQRLLELLQVLRRHRRPVSGSRLAGDLGVSLRTLYRDIATLQAQGASIEGEAGIGYVLRPGFVLPPLMFSDDEVDALALGLRWVADRADGSLADAAQDALAKIAAVLPPDRREEIDISTVLAGPGSKRPADGVDLGLIRKAIRTERKLALTYQDAGGAVSERIIWPVALGFFDQVRVLVAWCELRQDFRHFRADRMAALVLAAERYPRRRRALLQEWRRAQAIPPPP